MVKFTADQLMMLDGMGWQFLPTGPDEYSWIKFDGAGVRIASGGDDVWAEDIKVLDHAKATTFEDDEGLQAAVDAIMHLDLGPVTDNEFSLTLCDLVPKGWFSDSRLDVATHIARAIARSVLATMKPVPVPVPAPLPDPDEVWEPTAALRERVIPTGYTNAPRILEQRFIRTSGGPECGGGATEWRAVETYIEPSRRDL